MDDIVRPRKPVQRIDKEHEYELIRLAKSGDLEAAGMLYKQWEPLMMKICLRFRFRAELDEKMSFAAEAFMYTIRCFNLELGFRFSTYLSRAVTHILCSMRQELSKKKHNNFHFSAYERDDGEMEYGTFGPVSADTTLDRTHKVEATQRLQSAISELPPRKARIMEMRMKGLTFEEISKMECISRQRIQQIESKSKDELRRILNRSKKHAD